MTKSKHNDVETLHRISKRLRDLFHTIALYVGISDVAFNILVALYRGGEGCRQVDLSEWTARSKQTINSGIIRFIKRGYVEVIEREDRVKGIYLTPLGRNFVEEKILPFLELESQVFRSFPPEERQRIINFTIQYVEMYESEVKALLDQYKKKDMI